MSYGACARAVGGIGADPSSLLVPRSRGNFRWLSRGRPFQLVVFPFYQRVSKYSFSLSELMFLKGKTAMLPSLVKSLLCLWL